MAPLMALLPVLLDIGERRLVLSELAAELAAPLDLAKLLEAPAGAEPGTNREASPAPWEVEIGFGKGRYLVQRATAEPERRFLGIEIVSKYQRLVAGRARRKGLRNLVAVRGDAIYLMAAILPRSFAEAVHVYHPDPWPKKRHQKRRLFDPESVDLVLGLLKPGGTLYFGTDFLEYGARVQELLESHPHLDVHVLPGLWPGGPRTNYEAKYIEEGRSILRLTARLSPEARSHPERVHPEGLSGILAACAPKEGEADEEEGVARESRQEAASNAGGSISG